MTGRRLYDLNCDALKATERGWTSNRALAYGTLPPIAWAFLNNQQQTFWNDLARRITPKRKKP